MSEESRKADLLEQIKKNYNLAMGWEATARNNFIQDTQFAHGDQYNHYQWPTDIYNERVKGAQPCQTINKVRQHNLQIINDARQHQARIVFKPTGNKATYESAQMMTALMRHIEYKSRATQAYDKATEHQVIGGYGVLRVSTVYDGESFQTDIRIRPEPNPLAVLFDPAAQELDKSDGRFAFVFDDVAKDSFEELYPEYKGRVPSLTFGATTNDDWITANKVRIAEYFYVQEKSRTKVRTKDAEGRWMEKWQDELEDGLEASSVDNPARLAREVKWTEVHWALVIGGDIVEEKIFPGKYIPLVPVIGEETVINGVMDRKGHTRALVAPQQMYNYWASAAIEYGALQTKIPWIGGLRAFDGLENLWAEANRTNLGYLPYNDIDEDGNPINPPQKIAPPEQSQLYITGMTICRDEMSMVSGQYAATMGAQGNERSGVAIQERQRQGDNSTYHFINNQAVALRQVGTIIQGIIPAVYTQQRLVMVMGDDGKSFEVLIDPQAQKAYEEELTKDNEVAKRVLNPLLGDYSVEADVGPGFATQRQEAANAIQQILTNAPNLTGLIGDVLLRNMDFPGADEAAARLERMVPPQATGKGPTQKEMAQAEMIKQLGSQLESVMAKMAELELKLRGKEQARQIDTYKAETARLDVIHKHAPEPPPPEVINQLTEDMLQTDIDPVWRSATAAIEGRWGGLPMVIPGLGGQDGTP